MEDSNRPQSIFVSYKKENPYVNIDKTGLIDTSLSWKAKGILAYLLSLPSDWKVYADEISKHSTDGTKATSTGIKELMDKKYIHRKQLREKGKFIGYKYCVFEVPTESPFSENGKTENDFSENGKRHTTNYINKLNNKEINNNINIYSPVEDNVSVLTAYYQTIIDYLNSKAGTKYKATTEKTKKLICTRLKDGFTVEDFIQAIDHKCSEWLNTDMEKYLRPETLFGTKFESYLNQKANKTTGGIKDVAAGLNFNKVSEVSGDILDSELENIDF